MAHNRLIYLGTSALLGFSSLLYQTYCVHILFLYFPRSSTVVALAIAAFLAGLGISSLLFGRLAANNPKRHVSLIAMMQGAVIVLVLFFYRDIGFFEGLIDHGGDLYKTLLIGTYVFVPAFFTGGCFPLLNGLYIQSLESKTRDASNIYFWDLFGSVLGCLLTGYLLIPHLGIEPTILMAIGANLLIVILVAPWPYSTGLSAVTVILAISIFVLSSTEEDKSLTHQAMNADKKAWFQSMSRHLEESKYNILHQKQSRFGLVTAAEWGEPEPISFGLFINLRGMCKMDYRPQGLLSEETISVITALNLKPEARVVNIGLGCGVTAKKALSQPQIQSLDVYEINPAVIEIYDIVFDAHLKLRDNENFQLINADGASFLRSAPDKQYDAIIVDIEEVDIVYSSPIYTKEYISYAKNHLRYDGVFALWSFYVNDAFSRILFNTVNAVFPYTYLVSSEETEQAIMVFGSNEPMIIPENLKHYPERVNTIMALDLDDINTTTQPVLQNHYNPYEVFMLPDDYRDPFSTFQNNGTDGY